MEQLNEIVQQILGMQWSDYLDIIVVTFLIYKLIPLLISTGTGKIGRVVGMIIVVSWVTKVFDLHTMNFLLNQVLAIGLIALIVLYQPELRRVLDRLGNLSFKTFFGGIRRESDMMPVIRQTVRACEIMCRKSMENQESWSSWNRNGRAVSRRENDAADSQDSKVIEKKEARRTGALIVFARNNGLDEYIKSGTTLDAQVSDKLIRNIFFEKSPLHDGALIIRDGRIAAAGCLLPLSKSELIDFEGGTRHRAALGLSEVTDAVIVVVSEEKGTISLAEGGNLTRYLSIKTVEKRLCEIFCPEETDGEKGLPTRLWEKLRKQDQEDDQNEK